MLIDSHCHINFPELAANLDEILENMRRNDVTHALCIGVNLENFHQIQALAEQHEEIYASVGVHPDHESDAEPTVEQLVKLAQHPRVVAIGETGLDYFRLKGDLEWQRQRFRTHIRAARICGKPLIIHTREAAADTLRIMHEEKAAEVGGVMHCFTESLEVARAAMDMNFYISFSVPGSSTVSWQAQPAGLCQTCGRVDC
jgi:TatD DNase family protein